MTSFPTGGEALGSASFGLHADGLAAFEREMHAAGNAVDRFDNRIGRSVAQGGIFGGIRSQLQKFDDGLTRVIGPLLRILSIASAIGYAFYQVGSYIGNFLFPGAREFANELERAAELSKIIQAENAKMARGNKNRSESASDALAARKEAIQKRLDEIGVMMSEQRMTGDSDLIISNRARGIIAEQAALLRENANIAAQIRQGKLSAAAAPVATFGGANSPAALNAILRRGRGGGR